MPTRDINLPPEHDAFVQQMVLRTQIKAGLQAIDRGAFTDIDDADLDAALDELATPSAP
jgi:hypothetical protein